MNWRSVRTVALHDLRLVLSNKAVLVSMIITGGTFMVLLPIGAALGFGGLRNADPEVAMRLLSQFGDNVFATLPGKTPQDQMLYLVLAQLVAPLFLMQPVMLTSVIAADSFAGERERKTLEYLLHTPVTEKELLYGKMLAAWLPAVLLSALGPIPYLLVANHVLAPVVGGGIALPNLTWLTLMLFVTPGAAALALGLSVLISARVESFQAAYQSGPVVLMPFIGLMVGQFTGGVFLDTNMLFFVGIALWISAVVVITLGHRSFSRMQLLLGRIRKTKRRTAPEAA
jgi:ABC-type transport system involved in cytochrome c biogenesis permease component